ncbi:hypothetical protein K440DRAFT_638268 [Wilcoxina mikolae CBS 423.85]|nr:hypothetical protein K440DRAFT_638268 [Wilcoxina mikolae CBS 423.85]
MYTYVRKMADPTPTTPELDLESSSPSLQLLLNKKDLKQLCSVFSDYCIFYYGSIQRQIPEEVKSFMSDLKEVAKTARFSDDIFGHVLNRNECHPGFQFYAMLIFVTGLRVTAQILRLLSAKPNIGHLQSSLTHLARAESTQACVYIPPKSTMPQRALFVFNDPTSLEQFYNEVQSSTAEIKVQSLAEVLGSQIIKDTVKFLTELAHEIHKAVSLHPFWAEPSRCCLIQYRIREPIVTVLEFLLLAVEHLHELPQVLKRAARIIEELREPVLDPVINDSNRPGVNQSRLDPSESTAVQSDLPAGPGGTEPSVIQGPSGPLESLAAMGPWANHTNDLSELIQASKDLLGEAKAAKKRYVAVMSSQV